MLAALAMRLTLTVRVIVTLIVAGTATIAVIATIAATITYRDMNTMSVSKYNCSYSADHGTAYNYET